MFCFRPVQSRFSIDRKAEELILNTIRKITSATSRQRASSRKICSVLAKSHGLNESAIKLQITMMLATNKIANISKNGPESLKVVESNSESLKKNKKLSVEEDRLAECQQELQAVAEAASVDGEVEREDNGGFSEVSDEEDSAFETPNEMEGRMLALEKQVAEIFNRLAEKNDEKAASGPTGNPQKVEELEAKIRYLEKENRDLQEGNISIRLKFLEIQPDSLQRDTPQRYTTGISDFSRRQSGTVPSENTNAESPQQQREKQQKTVEILDY